MAEDWNKPLSAICPPPPQIISVLDGDEALESLEGDTWPDMVLLDYTLARGETGEQVRALHRMARNCMSPLCHHTPYMEPIRYEQGVASTGEVAAVRCFLPIFSLLHRRSAPS